MLSAKAPLEETCKRLYNMAQMIICASLFHWVNWSLVFKALLRRNQTDGTEVTHLKHCWFTQRFVGQKNHKSEDRLELTAKEFGIVVLLARNQGKILSKMMMPNRSGIWNFGQRYERRRKCGNDWEPKLIHPYTEKALIHTVRWYGLRSETRS